MEKRTRSKPVDWRTVRRRIRLWIAPVATASYWIGRGVREWFHPWT
ncbi:hypothetical protein [Streptomyces sp. NPDC002952]